MKNNAPKVLGAMVVIVVLASGLAWWRGPGAAANATMSKAPTASVPRGKRAPRDAGVFGDAAGSRGTAASCDNAFIPSVTGATRTYELRVGEQQFSVALTLREMRRDDEGVALDWSIAAHSGAEVMPDVTLTTRCSPQGDSQAPWTNFFEALSGIRYEGRRFAIPARAAPGDQWDSDAVWRMSDGLIREVRHARVTGREACGTPRGTRDCLRYEFDLEISDETTGPDRAATTHANGVEWVSEGIGLVRSVIDDGSGLGPQLTLTEMHDP